MYQTGDLGGAPVTCSRVSAAWAMGDTAQMSKRPDADARRCRALLRILQRREPTSLQLVQAARGEGREVEREPQGLARLRAVSCL